MEVKTTGGSGVGDGVQGSSHRVGSVNGGMMGEHESHISALSGEQLFNIL